LAERLGNFRRIKAKQLLAQGSSISDALRGAGYAESVASTQPANVVDPIKRDLAAALHRKKLDDDSLADHIIAALAADDLVYYQGDVAGEAPNWSARLQAMGLCIKVRGDEAPTKHQHSGSIGLTVNEVRAEQRSIWSRLQGIE
jgi:hypothetical protein